MIKFTVSILIKPAFYMGRRKKDNENKFLVMKFKFTLHNFYFCFNSNGFEEIVNGKASTQHK